MTTERTIWIGPCVHGRDPWDRCGTCEEAGEVQALTWALFASEEKLRGAYAEILSQTPRAERDQARAECTVLRSQLAQAREEEQRRAAERVRAMRPMGEDPETKLWREAAERAEGALAQARGWVEVLARMCEPCKGNGKYAAPWSPTGEVECTRCKPIRDTLAALSPPSSGSGVGREEEKSLCEELDDLITEAGLKLVIKPPTPTDGGGKR